MFLLCLSKDAKYFDYGSFLSLSRSIFVVIIEQTVLKMLLSESQSRICWLAVDVIHTAVILAQPRYCAEKCNYFTHEVLHVCWLLKEDRKGSESSKIEDRLMLVLSGWRTFIRAQAYVHRLPIIVFDWRNRNYCSDDIVHRTERERDGEYHRECRCEHRSWATRPWPPSKRRRKNFSMLRRLQPIVAFNDSYVISVLSRARMRVSDRWRFT